MNAALFLDIAAESTRDPQIAEATRAADCLIRSRLQEVLKRSVRAGAPELDPASACRRALVLQCVIEGLLVRAVRQPDLDRGTLRACLEKALAGLTAP